MMTKDETVNHVISKCTKLTLKKFNTMYDWIGKVIYRGSVQNIEI